MAVKNRVYLSRAFREAFAGCSSGPVYYNSIGHAADTLCKVCDDWGYDFAYRNDWYGDEGRASVAILDDDGDEIAYAYCAWYTMPSGRIELTCYIG
jgi:hypothetical protein